VTQPTDLLVSTSDGLFCPEGSFHIDPWRAVDRAIITHAHSDHVSSGCNSYVCSTQCKGVLQERLGPSAAITGWEYGATESVGSVRVSLHPAGHILGSAQVRVERAATAASNRGETWVFSGDYKDKSDSTCQALEVVPCDVFISESTFGLPIYRWPDEQQEMARVSDWWRDNAARGRTSMLFAYALGKAQRLLAGVDPSIGPIGVHGAVDRFNRAYRAAGVQLPPAPHAAGDEIARLRGTGLIIAPPSTRGSPWIRKFAGAGAGISMAFASGWMSVRGGRRRSAVDRGFIVSDHADWPGLLSVIAATGASQVGVTHGYVGPLVRWLTESGREAFAVPTRYTGERGEETEKTVEPDSLEPAVEQISGGEIDDEAPGESTATTAAETPGAPSG
jgi:putative mRNA 3-end processing factor